MARQGAQLLAKWQSTLFAPLSHSMHKGQGGRIGVIGGCLEYTGAPFYAAYSSLKVGGDLAFVFCTEEAAIPIKCYSPELIVYPILPSSPKSTVDTKSRFLEVLPRLSALVIGPGLGRNKNVMDAVKDIFSILKQEQTNIPIVLDADTLWLLSTNRDLLAGISNCVLLPNAPEYARLCHKDQTIEELSNEFNAIIIQKKKEDTIAFKAISIDCSHPNSARRCGGQGDVLAGTTSVFLYWAHRAITSQEKKFSKEEEREIKMAACLAACTLVRECNQRAFDKHYRGTTTVEMIAEIGQVFQDLFEQ